MVFGVTLSRKKEIALVRIIHQSKEPRKTPRAAKAAFGKEVTNMAIPKEEKVAIKEKIVIGFVSVSRNIPANTLYKFFVVSLSIDGLGGTD